MKWIKIVIALMGIIALCLSATVAEKVHWLSGFAVIGWGSLLLSTLIWSIRTDSPEILVFCTFGIGIFTLLTNCITALIFWKISLMLFGAIGLVISIGVSMQICNIRSDKYVYQNLALSTAIPLSAILFHNHRFMLAIFWVSIAALQGVTLQKLKELEQKNAMTIFIAISVISILATQPYLALYSSNAGFLMGLLISIALCSVGSVTSYLSKDFSKGYDMPS